MNLVILAGRLTKNPEVRYTDSQIAVASFTVAIDRKTKDKKTDFIPCKAWGGTAEFIDRHFLKGDGINLNGEFRVDNYTDKDGSKKSFTYVNVSSVEFPLGKVKGKDDSLNEYDILPDDGELPFI